MAERPLMFSPSGVRAILQNRKTQTRRLVKPQPGPMDRPCMMEDGSWHATDSRGGNMSPLSVPWRAGDRLWVREAASWPRVWDDEPARVCIGRVFYLASADAAAPSPWLRAPEADHGRVKSPIHMPRALSRITLEVTEVRVQRLQVISAQDALAEGIALCAQPQEAFRDLWNHLHGPAAWDANPWVVALSFARPHEVPDDV